MTRRFPVRTLTTTGLLLAVGLLLPIVFHSLFGAAGGKMFLPMHYAVLLGGCCWAPLQELSSVSPPPCSARF